MKAWSRREPRKRARPCGVRGSPRMLALAREPAALRALELRIAPQKDLRGWIDFAKLWQAGFPEERSGRGNATSAEVRFVVHFIPERRSGGLLDVPDALRPPASSLGTVRARSCNSSG